MQDKLDIYDILGVLVPGVLVVCAVPLAFPTVSQAVAAANLPEGFAIVGLTAASVFAGYLVQALASLLEPVLSKTWGGRASERALTSGLGDRYFCQADGTRIRAKLIPLAHPEAKDQSLFQIAMQIAENCGSARIARFNALYAYHRALVLLAVIAIGLFVWSFAGGIASRLTWNQNIAIVAVLLSLLVLFWYRAKQRGVYYVREVLYCAERQLSQQNCSTGG
jgi:hypothetical protein